MENGIDIDFVKQALEESVKELKNLTPKEAIEQSIQDSGMEELKALRSEREVVYEEFDRLGISDSDKTRLLGLCYDALDYVSKTGGYNPWTAKERQKLFKKAKKTIEDYVNKQNQWLVNQDPHFQQFPINVKIDDHYLDSAHPPKDGSRGKGKTLLIKELSDILITKIPNKPERAELIARILRAFGGLSRSETYPPSLTKHF
ncbi:MAG: hypothetical protein SWQ30_00010 [Thermodesulfobacteriota bacterium]|nr:hypothetical protein [Thermodesulfobacteriota bacterium]